MKKLVGICAILFAISIFASASAQVGEAWVARYNGPADSTDTPRDIAVDDAGNVYVTGFSVGSSMNTDFVTIKYAPNGDTLWVRRYNGPANTDDEAQDVAVDAAGNVYVTGPSGGVGSYFDWATIKYGPNGNQLWVRRYNGPANAYDYSGRIAVDDSGNVYVNGIIATLTSPWDYGAIKYDSTGTLKWVATYDGPGSENDFATDLVLDDSGSLYITGYVRATDYTFDYTTVKYDLNGDTLWVRSYSGPANGDDYAGSQYFTTRVLAVDGNHNLLVTGYSLGIGSGDDYATIKYKPNGDTLWVRRYNGTGNFFDYAWSLVIDKSDNVFVTGTSWGGPTNYDYATVKYNANGDTIWARRYNGSANDGDGARAMAADSNGNVYVTGGSTGAGTLLDYATIKYAPNGDTLWLTRYNGPGGGSDEAVAVALDTHGYVYVTGTSPGNTSGVDFATIKYVQSPYPLIIQAFSPVNLIVTDPNNDSIGIDFNTIPGATYTAANDSIYIPTALIGDYRIRVVKDLLDPSGDTSYSIDVRIDGTADQAIASNEPVPDIGESHTYIFTSDDQKLYCISEPGDANADGNHTLSDVIATVNYIFNKSGCAPKPDCWFKGPICRGNWNGDALVTLSDVIRAVNYIFNKPGGPWNPIAVEPCCLPM